MLYAHDIAHIHQKTSWPTNVLPIAICLVQPLISLQICWHLLGGTARNLRCWLSTSSSTLEITGPNLNPVKHQKSITSQILLSYFCSRHELQTCVYVLDKKNANIWKLIIKDKIFKCTLTCKCNNNIIKSYYLIWHCTSLGWFNFNTDISVATCTHSIK